MSHACHAVDCSRSTAKKFFCSEACRKRDERQRDKRDQLAVEAHADEASSLRGRPPELADCLQEAHAAKNRINARREKRLERWGDPDSWFSLAGAYASDRSYELEQSDDYARVRLAKSAQEKTWRITFDRRFWGDSPERIMSGDFGHCAWRGSRMPGTRVAYSPRPFPGEPEESVKTRHGMLVPDWETREAADGPQAHLRRATDNFISLRPLDREGEVGVAARASTGSSALHPRGGRRPRFSFPEAVAA